MPPDERHGKVWHQGTFWFMGNFVAVTLATGFIGASLGLSLVWAGVAVVLGCLFGTFFMAFHAAQGPTMGLPQMIQSRAQFGSQGSLIPLAAVAFVYIGFNVFDIVFAGEGLDTVFHAPKLAAYVVVTVIGLLIAVVGHELLHFLQRWLSYLSVAVFTVFTVAILATSGISHAAARGHFVATAFLLQLGVAASYQISYAPYVSDYSRYLPEKTRVRVTVFWVYIGAAASAIWLMLLGALLTALTGASDAITALYQSGNHALSGLGSVTVLVAVPALVTVMAVNSYGAMLTSAAAVDGFRKVPTTVRTRVIGVVAVVAISFGLALLIPSNSLTSFNNFLLLMLYFLVPWTAVNLVDFYFVRRGHYDIAEILKTNGIYGRWGWRGLTAYCLGFLAMVPFFSNTIYTGPVAQSLNGADISWAIGLPVAGFVYYALSLTLAQADGVRVTGTAVTSIAGEDALIDAGSFSSTDR